MTVGATLSGIEGLVRLLRGVARFVRGVAFVTLLAVAAIASALARGEFSVADGVLTALLLVPVAILLLFSFGLLEVARLPERLRRLPNEGREQLAELTRIAGEAGSSRPGFRRTTSHLWRLRGVADGARGLVGISLPLRVFAPPFLAATFASLWASFPIVCAGLIALVLLAFG